MIEQPVLETTALEKRFGGVRAVAGIDFRLGRGELRCLIGPNGAGKSTFFKLLTGQVRATSGRIALEGRDITQLPPHEIAALGVGIKNQVPSVFDGLSVRENVFLAACHRFPARAKAIANEILDRFRLSGVASQSVGTLAHGLRQWVDIGMVTAQRPTLVLLDEPTAGMAAEEVGRMVEVIREINSAASIIVVEHDMQFIRRLDAPVTVLHQGRILLEGAMEDVGRDPRVRQVYLGSSRHA